MVLQSWLPRDQYSTEYAVTPHLKPTPNYTYRHGSPQSNPTQAAHVPVPVWLCAPGRLIAAAALQTEKATSRAALAAGHWAGSNDGGRNTSFVVRLLL
jgi:hypothetical protein